MVSVKRLNPEYKKKNKKKNLFDNATFVADTKGSNPPSGAGKNGVGLAPLQKFYIDLTGPHRRSAGEHVYLLTGICCFNKYLIVVPLRDKSALTIANALLKHVYLIYGACEFMTMGRSL